MRIYLIGFMGTGKTTLGAQVAAKMNVPFIDTDQLIEEQENATINQIFAAIGEENFRKLEASILRITSSHEKALIATGGGLPLHNRNMEWMLQHGITMYLKWPEDILVANLVQHRTIRPLLSELSVEEAVKKALSLLEERKPVYEQSSMTLELEGNIEADLNTLLKACQYIW